MEGNGIRQEGQTLRRQRIAVESPFSAGTHRGHMNLFRAVPRTPSGASESLFFNAVPFGHPAFTALTRVQIPWGTPTESRAKAKSENGIPQCSANPSMRAG